MRYIRFSLSIFCRRPSFHAISLLFHLLAWPLISSLPISSHFPYSLLVFSIWWEKTRTGMWSGVELISVRNSRDVLLVCAYLLLCNRRNMEYQYNLLPTNNVTPGDLIPSLNLFLLYFRAYPQTTSNGDESMPMNGLASFSTQPNTYNYSTGFRDSSIEATTTNSGYYEDILDADPHGQSTTPGGTGRGADTGNRKRSVVSVLPGVDQGAA